MEILFVNACPRGPASRTLALGRTFLDAATKMLPDATVTEQCLADLKLRPVSARTLRRKERLCDEGAFDDPLLKPARVLQRADAVVVAAPYWDLSFPSVLKIWVENMYVRNLTFRYERERPVGLCRGRESFYVTTAGSPIGTNDWGAGYMRAVLTTLGISAFTPLRAEGLDLEGNDAESILRDAGLRAREAAGAWAERERRRGNEPS